MLKVDKGYVEFQGTNVLILSELTTMMHSLLEYGIDKDNLLFAVELATKSNDELDKEIIKALDKKIEEKKKEQEKAKNDLENAIKDLIKVLFDD